MDRSKIALIFLATFLTFLLSLTAPATPVSTPSFKFHLKSFPKTLDPVTMTAGESTYLFSQLFRGLTRFTGHNGLVFDQAQKCRYRVETELLCELRKEAKWNDGKSVTAQDFVRGFQRLLSPESQTPVASLLFGLKNARAVYAGKMKGESLGVKALPDGRLELDLEEEDREFLEKLSNPLLVPYRAAKDSHDLSTVFTNGPYQIKKWVSNQRIELEPFNDYFGGKVPRPNVEIVFASEDAAAIILYEKGVINFLWRLTTVNIPKYKDRPDFVQIPQARYDYLGFDLRPSSPFAKKEIREAFAQAINFDDFKKVFFALGAPGCPGLEDPFMDPDGHCQEFAPNQKKLDLTGIKLMFSQLGGDDIRRSAEFFQGQWQDHLGVHVELRDMEQKQYLALLKKSPPPLFRKGVSLNRPTCQAALENFSKDHPENYTGFENAHFDNLVKALSHQKLSLSEKESICGVASDILFKEEYVGIPLGRIHFTLLASPLFQGWKLNELNQLDLSQLTFVGGAK